MSILTVTAKGQVRLPKEILEHLGVRPGDKLVLAKIPAGRVEVKAARSPGRISDVFGILKKKNGPRLSIDEINEVTVRGWAGRK
jgi:AbrB family looped-hinge helix DNA binding protein